jgi:hypothetical protein
VCREKNIKRTAFALQANNKSWLGVFFLNFPENLLKKGVSSKSELLSRRASLAEAAVCEREKEELK